ncbi:MAG: hypothetical protein JGK17_25790 [Microcoleus sp. PH2017_10_PVI_O_A]|uniref:hypothetical protein n=1 Tax=unclassified Microcoleus TaxID=2642155 RepID=UPI001DBE8502|nr:MULTISPECIES: hypothetical protein [unclassified Microcoleus]TAE78050.1 MAG: hypothetical protein EAZ83_25430 [Oscillatoriales cyanobacterium]MCC3408924.1 hypothetical protein [Microcoleus sp. PH2017_10_PVI_O_A]MCC3463060.1 hypothetical protein [Microcoleus sp. PH2017_11_PCY_U_A]MCC3481446.1 hypothetical protein [Microcoleus sp. PH2017_12_PCY_D_A]MCC3531446.1 hypothetical protein [Microcoleus sp. PH2017_21_RUC_O_A]
MRLSIEVWGEKAAGVVFWAGVFFEVKLPITEDCTMRGANFLIESRDRTCTHRTSLDLILYELDCTERSHLFTVSDLKKPNLSQLA